MLLSLLLLFGTAFVVGSAFHSADDEEDYRNEDEERSVSADSLLDDGERENMLDAVQIEDSEIERAESNLRIDLDQYDVFDFSSPAENIPLTSDEVISESGAGSDEFQIDWPASQFDGANIDMDDVGFDSTFSPAGDFTDHVGLPIIDANGEDSDAIYIDLPPDQGSLTVVRADYYERIGFGEHDDFHILHSGANIYYIPDGSEFPSEISWSPSGVGLLNESGEIANESDLGAVRLLARLDTGDLYEEIDSPLWKSFSDQAFSRLQILLSSNEVIDFR